MKYEHARVTEPKLVALMPLFDTDPGGRARASTACRECARGTGTPCQRRWDENRR